MWAILVCMSGGAYCELIDTVYWDHTECEIVLETEVLVENPEWVFGECVNVITTDSFGEE